MQRKKKENSANLTSVFYNFAIDLCNSAIGYCILVSDEDGIIGIL